jgi:tRNA/rRNA methyltransferase
MNLNRCRVVLVRTEVAGNLGAAARVMRNVGLTDLRLVNPKARLDDPQARQFSTHGEEILKNAQVVSSLAGAVGDCVLVVGTSARIGGPFRLQSARTPRQLGPTVVQSLQTGPAAIVFGPEPSGLTNEEIIQCHYLINIPTDPAYSALNLAQAIAICLYEIRCASLESAGNSAPAFPPASYQDQDRMFGHLKQALTKIHFLYGETADSLMHALRHLIGRAKPSAMELGILHGLARQLLWIAGKTDPKSLQSEDGGSEVNEGAGEKPSQ